MGQYFCCMKQPSGQEESKRVNPCDSNCSTPVFPISKMKIKQDQIHLTSTAARKLAVTEPFLTSPATRKLAMTEPLTLEQYLMDSPNLNISLCTDRFGVNDETNVVEKYQKINLSSPDLHSDFFTPRLSFSSDKLGLLQKIDEDENDDEASYGSLTGGKVKKRVSFKLPEEADIIIFYSPEETFEEY